MTENLATATITELEALHASIGSQVADLKARWRDVAAELQRRAMDEELAKLPDALRAHFAQRLGAQGVGSTLGVGTPGAEAP